MTFWSKVLLTLTRTVIPNPFTGEGSPDMEYWLSNMQILPPLQEISRHSSIISPGFKCLEMTVKMNCQPSTNLYVTRSFPFFFKTPKGAMTFWSKVLLTLTRTVIPNPFTGKGSPDMECWLAMQILPPLQEISRHSSIISPGFKCLEMTVKMNCLPSTNLYVTRSYPFFSKHRKR